MDLPLVHQRELEKALAGAIAPLEGRDPASPEARYEHAIACLVSEGDPKEALAALELAIAAGARACFLTARALARHMLDDFDGAAADAARALELDPADPEPRRLRAAALQAKGDAAGAIADLERYVAALPAYGARALRTRAEIARLRGERPAPGDAYRPSGLPVPGRAALLVKDVKSFFVLAMSIVIAAAFAFNWIDAPTGATLPMLGIAVPIFAGLATVLWRRVEKVRVCLERGVVVMGHYVAGKKSASVSYEFAGKDYSANMIVGRVDKRLLTDDRRAAVLVDPLHPERFVFPAIELRG